jgi:hypothetical protein
MKGNVWRYGLLPIFAHEERQINVQVNSENNRRSSEPNTSLPQSDDTINPVSSLNFVAM